MKIRFSTAWSAIAKECGSKFPDYSDENALKNLIFSRLRDGGWTPVRILGVEGDRSKYHVRVDVPKASDIKNVNEDVFPFTSKEV